MSCDKLVFDLAQEIEGTPNIFVKKDWLNILDNQNGNYGANQSIIDTSQLSNSNKYMSYREGYILMPLLLTVTSSTGTTTDANAANFAPNSYGTSADYAFGLKNWFGSMIHSLTLDYNGTTIIQQTPFCNMWNSFKLMTSLSWNDVATIGSTIGFYPDDPLSWSFEPNANDSGQGTCNNTNYSDMALGIDTSGLFNVYKLANGNMGLLQRQSYINFDTDGRVDINQTANVTYGNLLFNAPSVLWKSYILKKSNGTNYVVGPPAVPSVGGVFQIAITATIYLRHLHSFFQMVPLLKGVYMKMTMNLNNTSTNFTQDTNILTLLQVSNSVGGVNPLMICSTINNNGGALAIGDDNFYTASIGVGAICLNQQQKTMANVTSGPIANVYLYLPAYTFNPPFEQAYLSSPVKKIQYTDIYQYQIQNIQSDRTFNNLLTNGIANLKSVLCIPYFSPTAANSGIPDGIPVFQSPFDPAGCGPSSPLCLLTNFNVVVSGQNAIYNTEKYSFEQFNNQLYGVNAVNGGLTDGLTSGLINALGFEMEYCYYYVDVSRMLPVEESVPKSISIIGQNKSRKQIDLWCFVEYGVEVNIDVLTGARV